VGVGSGGSRATIEVRAPLAIAAAIPLLMLWTLPWADHGLAALPGFMGAWLALVFACDAVTAFLLVGQYRVGGGPRLLVLSCAYLWSASTVVLIAFAVPGILATDPALGTDPNSMWWLWALRHVGPPLFIGLALAPWPAAVVDTRSAPTDRRRRAGLTLLAFFCVVAALALTIVHAPAALPVIVDPVTRHLTDSTAAGIVLVNVLAVVLSVLGVARRGSHRTLECWAVVAAVAFLGDVTFTFMWEPTFSVADYGAHALALAGSVTVPLFMLRDVSVRHYLAAKDAHRLEEQNAELREANALRAHVTAVVSHDMRTPLAGLQGYLEMLQDDDLDPGFAKRMVDRSWMLTRRLTLLSENLLAAATLEHADLVVIRERLDMKQQLAECATCFPDLDLRVECPPDLTVHADSMRLQQVLANLVRNAQKHGAEPVLLKVTGDESKVTIRVSDAGPGVPTDFVPHLFDRYTQGSDTAKGGSGLGLSVVKDLAAAHGGDASYDKATAAFVVTLPSATTRPRRELDENVRV
jgi:signal transduction histidine kinase